MRLVYWGLAWSAGIVLAAALPQRLPVIWVVALLPVFAGAMLHQRQRTAWVALALFVLGGLRLSIIPATSAIAQYNNLGGMTIEGVVVREPDVRDTSIHLRVQAETVTRAGSTEPTEGLVLVRAPRTALDVAYGDRIRATGLLITPAEMDTFSYRDFLAREGVFSILTDTSIEIVGRETVNTLYSGLLQLKASAAYAITTALPEPQAGLLRGMLLGDESRISLGTEAAFAATGAAHVVAISGFNMAVVSRAILAVLQRLNVGRRTSAAVSIGFIVLYSLLVGGSAAVLRAALMSSLLILGETLRRKTYVPASLAFAALLLTALNPYALWDIGFQLSFAAVMGLALFVEPLQKSLDHLLAVLLPGNLAQRIGNFLAEPLVVSIAAQIMVTPLIALYFGRFSPVSLLVNLLIVPVQPFVIILGGLATFVALLVPILGQIIYWLAFVPLAWTTTVVRLFAGLSFADIAFTLDRTFVTTFFILITGWAMAHAVQPDWLLSLARFIRSRAVVSAAMFGAVAVLVLTGGVLLSRPDGKLHVWFLDMGHSNVVLAQTPGGAHILIDGGRYPSRLLTAIGERLPFNDREIEVLAMTQPDENEFAALPAVLERYRIGATLVHGQPNEGEAFAQLRALLGQYPLVTVQAGYQMQFSDGTLLEVLHPAGAPTLGDSLNENALVLRLHYGEQSFLLTGDLSAVGQEQLISRSLAPASVLQLPMHGAARSLDEQFLKMVQPQIVVLQSDPANRLGDPDADTLAMLGGLPLYRTDQGGTVHVWTDGQNVWTEYQSSG